ncbi:MAG: ChpI protein [Acidimicrobiaceae bacterium]|nr:ChpI protein [Acidimicrobiaceae bacterium]MYE69492.1 ChpI protein [Gemmatimonadota bacterium]
MKVAVSIPDPLFAEADRLAKRRKLSRSQLYAEALELLVSHEDRSEITRRINEVCSRVDSSLDPGLAAAQSEALREEW